MGDICTLSLAQRQLTRASISENIYVRDVVDVKGQEDAFDHLVLPDEVKHTLKAISCSYVKAQKNSRVHHADIVKGKGEGKIFL